MGSSHFGNLPIVFFKNFFYRLHAKTNFEYVPNTHLIRSSISGPANVAKELSQNGFDFGISSAASCPAEIIQSRVVQTKPQNYTVAMVLSVNILAKPVA